MATTSKLPPISKAQYFYIAVIILIIIVVYFIWSAVRKAKAKQAEIDKLISDFSKNSYQDQKIANEFELPVEKVSWARDIAFNVSLLLETNKELSWWERNADNLLFVSQWIWGNKGVWQQNIDEAVEWLNKIRHREDATLVQTFYSEMTGGNNLKIDIEKHIPVVDRKNIYPYRFFN